MNEMISQCPKCMTSFRVTDEQLQVAAGQVRCGYCMNVFMGRDYLISGGDSGESADEDVLRSLLDSGENAADDPQEHFDNSSFATFDTSTTDATATQFEDIATDEQFSFGASTETITENDSSSGISSDDFVVDDIDDIEPGINLLDENLKFDEDDLRTSSDEDWALALLAELDRPSKSDSTDEAGSSEVGADANAGSSGWDPLQEMLESAEAELRSTAEPKPERKSKPGLGFEEIVVDVVPSNSEPLEQATESTSLDDSATAEREEAAGGDADVDFAQSEAAVLLVNEDPETDYELAPEIDAIESVRDRSQTGELSQRSEAVTSGDVWGADQEESIHQYQDVLKPDEETPEANSAHSSVQSKDGGLFEDAASVYATEPPSARDPSDNEDNALVQALLENPPQEVDRRQPAEGENDNRRATDFLPQHIELDTEQIVEPVESQPLQWRWLAAAVGMLALLGLQYTFFYWGDLVASSKTRPALASVCNIVGCELPPFRDLNNIKIEKLVMRVHAEVDSAMTVDVIIRNKAALEQPFPVLQLTFSDMNNLPIATRKFFPNEYLDGELRGLSSMPRGSPVRLSLHVMDPGAEGINYSLEPLPSL